MDEKIKDMILTLKDFVDKEECICKRKIYDAIMEFNSKTGMYVEGVDVCTYLHLKGGSTTGDITVSDIKLIKRRIL
jgi:hypothetical protein